MNSTKRQSDDSTHSPLLEGKVAIITGASRGIGTATARVFSAEGASVALAARDEAALESLAQELSIDEAGAIAVPTDVGDAAAIEQLVDATVSAFGRLDVAFNNAAGGGQAPTPMADLPVDAYDSAIAITLRSVFLSMKYEIPAMLESGGGAIVNMSSTAGLEAVGGLAGYVSAKHGVIGLTKAEALEYANQGIRVNAVAPGPILTENLEEAGPDMQHKAGMAMPMQRIGQPAEVARAVLWLCSDQATYTTGATLPSKAASSPVWPPSPSLRDRPRNKSPESARRACGQLRSPQTMCGRRVLRREKPRDHLRDPIGQFKHADLCHAVARSPLARRGVRGPSHFDARLVSIQAPSAASRKRRAARRSISTEICPSRSSSPRVA